ncbi:hypothetical protein [Novosphingobium sp. ST904]|uniref:hypothetical protein n=1 Tax=Novosphingobium sp. ST904 TaxID=1684385 RepID=UPI0006C88C9C|nr:hypothetical protein [Novosphingobium sp. ST904]KPH63549.1 hypothetical protein ADT71_12930 [Novosphingobium sp. ST904]TCM32400.1 hypothetical protein EDF59_12495 [Novosphingobium sp. ST904]
MTTLLRTFSPRLERLIGLYYGIGVPQAGAGEVAESFGITRARIDMLRKEALRRMRIAARHIDAAEPELIADPAYPLPGGWAMPDMVNRNARFLARLNEARGLPVASVKEHEVAKKRKPRNRKASAMVRTWAPSPTRQALDPAFVHRSALVDGLIGAGQVVVLPAGATAIVAGAEYGGIVGLLAGFIAMPVMAFAYERWMAGR